METEKVDIKEIKKVLSDTKMIIEHNRKLTIAKGAHFNLFTVLDIETKENKTHSAFLAELLNPKGSHLKGNVFLKLFLEVLKTRQKLKKVENKSFNAETGVVKVEKSIGPIDLQNKKGEDPSKATGGRIDIYLKDGKGNIISIENKIHALDQEAQIQRYCNHKKAKNTVYYLTLKGEDPTDYSRLKLKAGKDFFNISYRDDIVMWLELCLKEVSNFTSLREAINQYILLIKKLTNTLDNKTEQELFEVMIDNLEASKYVAENYQKLTNKIKEKFRTDVKTKLESILDLKDYKIEKGNSIDSSFAQLWINYLGVVNHKFVYGVETFSGRGNRNGNMFVGVFGTEMLPSTFSLIDLNGFNKYWQHVKSLTTTDGDNLNLNSSAILKRINEDNLKDKKKYDVLLDKVVNEITNFIKDTEKQLGFISLTKEEDDKTTGTRTRKQPH